MSTRQHGGRVLTRKQIKMRPPPFQHPLGGVHPPKPPTTPLPFRFKGLNKKKKKKIVIKSYEPNAQHDMLAGIDADIVDRDTVPTRLTEQKLAEEGFFAVCGVDDSGRGCLAGPIIAVACHVPMDVEIPDLLTRNLMYKPTMRRDVFAALICHPDIKYSIASVEAKEIDDTSVAEAALKAQRLAIEGLPTAPDFCLIDGIALPKSAGEGGPPMHANMDASDKMVCVTAAKLIARETRENLMKNEFHTKYKGYHFKVHHGNPATVHMNVLEKRGPTPDHRMNSPRLQEVFEIFKVKQAKRVQTRLRLEAEAAAVAQFAFDRKAYLDAALAKKGINL